MKPITKDEIEKTITFLREMSKEEWNSKVKEGYYLFLDGDQFHIKKTIEINQKGTLVFHFDTIFSYNDEYHNRVAFFRKYVYYTNLEIFEEVAEKRKWNKKTYYLDENLKEYSKKKALEQSKKEKIFKITRYKEDLWYVIL